MRSWLACIGMIMGLGMQTSWGQCCSGGVPIAGNLSLPSGGAHELQFQLTYDYNRLRALFFEADNLQDNSRQRSTHSVLLESSYGFKGSWSVAMLLSMVGQERIIETIPGQRQFTGTTGLGDVVFLLRKNLISRQKWGMSIGAGPKLPVGRNDVRDETGLWLSADLQPGSGAWDAMFWTSASVYDLFKQNLNLSFTGTARFTTTGN